MFQQLRNDFYVNWETQKFVGEGGFGTCHLVECWDRNGKMSVYVVKMLRIDRLTEEDQAAFTKEEYHMSKFNGHRNLIKYIGGCVNEKNPTQRGILMEYCTKGSLKEILLNPEIYYPGYKFICWAFDLFDALDYLNRQGAIHTDVKPENILVTWEFELKIADFGAMKSGPMENGTSWSGYSPPRGTTTHYQAPELYEKLTPKNDVFAMGVVLWELIERRSILDSNGSYVEPPFKMAPKSCPENIQNIVTNCTHQWQDRWDASVAKGEVEKAKKELEDLYDRGLNSMFVEREVKEKTGHKKVRKPFDSDEEDDELVMPPPKWSNS